MDVLAAERDGGDAGAVKKAYRAKKEEKRKNDLDSQMVRAERLFRATCCLCCAGAVAGAGGLTLRALPRRLCAARIRTLTRRRTITERTRPVRRVRVMRGVRMRRRRRPPPPTRLPLPPLPATLPPRIPPSRRLSLSSCPQAPQVAVLLPWCAVRHPSLPCVLSSARVAQDRQAFRLSEELNGRTFTCPGPEIRPRHRRQQTDAESSLAAPSRRTQPAHRPPARCT
jgi:hypothetical protein